MLNDKLTIGDGRAAARHNQAAISIPSERCDRPLEGRATTYSNRAHFNTKRRCNRLERTQLATSGWIFTIPEDCRSRHIWGDLLEHF